MVKLVSLLLAVFLYAGTSYAQVPDSVKIFVDSSLNVMQRSSVFSTKVNWKQVRDSVRKMTAQAQTYEATYTAIQYAFHQLGDKHGKLVFNGESYRNPFFTFDTTRIPENIKQAARKGPHIYTGFISGQYAYLSIPTFGGQATADVKQFAQRLQDSLCKNINGATKGIILDLRLNGGGNVFPMIAGIANVLGEGSYGKGIDAAGNTTEEYAIRNGAISWYDSIPLKIEHTCGNFSTLPVALLLSPVTASAGEDIAIAFTGRPKTILIGENTGGFVTANDGIYLPGPKNGIVLAMGFLQDRNGKAYFDNVVPDIKIISGDYFFEPVKDEKIKAAVKWLKKQ